MKSCKVPIRNTQKTENEWNTKIGIKIKGEKQENTNKYGRY